MKLLGENVKINPLVVLFVLIDTFCLYLYADKMGLPLPMAIILSLLVAAVLDVLSYVASFYGAGKLFKIPKIAALPETITARKIACMITVVACVLIIGFQGALIYIRYGQIVDKNSEFSSSKKSYENTIQENKFKSEGERIEFIIHKPKYDGDLVMDYLSIIVPIATTILSFVMGMICVEEFDPFTKDKERIKEEIEKLTEQTNDWLNKADSHITDFQTAGDTADLREIILSDIEGKNTKELGVFINTLEKKLKTRAPELYESHIKKLIPCLKEISHEICEKLSHGANTPSIIHDIDLMKDFEGELNKLETPEKLFPTNEIKEV